MPTTHPFETRTDRYDRWFETHEAAYRSEVDALSRRYPADAFGLEVGVGTGRFAASLDVDVGIDPAPSALARAADRGVTAVRGVAEALPFPADRFDAVLFVTTVCFVDDLRTALAEARRVLRPGGAVVVGYVDRESPVGRRYEARAAENPFYRDATFVSTADLREHLAALGFTDLTFAQTVFTWPDDMADSDPVREGHGSGSFVALRAQFEG